MNKKASEYQAVKATWLLFIQSYQGKSLGREIELKFETLDQLRLYHAAAEQLGFTTEVRGYGRIPKPENMNPKHA